MIGETISHYTITEKLGEGGMGVVYKARDLRLDRFVAIKLLAPHLGRDEEAVKRFVHEAKAASALNHPNVATIYEIDETPDGRTFIVMAYYEAKSLRDLIEGSDIGVDTALDIAWQVAGGLAIAHEKGIVHRDIKPSNILITRDGRAEIIDFGLAKLAGSTRLTREGSTLGTAAYMSPEQAKGEETDHRSDIFSLGVILYEMLAGEPPFKGEHEAALLYEIVHENPQPLSDRKPDLPEGLKDVVERALAKNPADRHDSSLELADDLRRLRREPAVSYVRSGGPEPPRGFVRKRWMAAAVLFVLLAAFAAVFVISRFRGPAGGKDSVLAIVDFTDLGGSDDHTLSAGLTGLVHAGLVESSPCRVVSPTYLQDIRRRLFGEMRGPIEDSEALEVARRSGATILLSGQIMPGKGSYVAWHLVDVGNGQSLAARRAPGEELAELADGIVKSVLPLLAERCGVEAAEPPRSAADLTTADPQAYRHYIAGLLAREEGRTQQELEHLQKAISIDTTFAMALYELSDYYTRESGFARIYADRAWRHRTRLGRKDLMLLEAWRQWIEYRTEDAISTHRRILEQWPDDRKVLESLTQKLFANWYAGEALEVARKGLELFPSNAEFSWYLWYSLAMYGRFEEARKVIESRIAPNIFIPANLCDLGTLYTFMCMPDSADAVFRIVLKMEPGYIWSERGLAANLYFRGDIEGAIEAYGRLLERDDLSQRITLIIYNQIVNPYPGLCVILAESGRFQDALAVIEESKRHAPHFEDELRYVWSTRNALLLRLGRAREVLAQAREMKQSDVQIARLQALSYEAQALAALDSLAQARRAVEELQAAEPYWGGFAALMALKVGALIALSEGDADGAIALVRKMDELHGRALGGLYDISAREILAAAHGMAGRPEKAADVHRGMLKQYGGHALSHYELGKLYEEMKRPKDARREYEIFLEMWSRADKDLPQPADARRRLSSLASL